MATALQTQMENQQIRARNAANQRYANSQRQEIYDLVAKKEKERPVVHTAMEIYNQIKFTKWDQAEIFKKIKLVTNGLMVIDDNAGFILNADFYGLDENVIIDGTIRAKLYDENHLYAGQALLTLPKFGTRAEKNNFYGYIPNPSASKYYSVEYEPYYLWQIEANEDSPIKSATDLSWAMAKFGKPNLTTLATKHEDELHYANAMRLLRTNNLYALSEAQEEINLMSNSSEANAYTEKFHAATIALKDDIYNSAIKLSESDYYLDVEKAVEKFNTIIDWKNSKELSGVASKKAKDLNNEYEYQKGITAFEKNDYNAAKTHFIKCVDWKDSKDYITKCDIEKRNKKKRTVTMISIIACIVAIVALYATVIKPKQDFKHNTEAYNQAIELLKENKNKEAYLVLNKLGAFENSIEMKTEAVIFWLEDVLESENITYSEEFASTVQLTDDIIEDVYTLVKRNLNSRSFYKPNKPELAEFYLALLEAFPEDYDLVEDHKFALSIYNSNADERAEIYIKHADKLEEYTYTGKIPWLTTWLNDKRYIYETLNGKWTDKYSSSAFLDVNIETKNIVLYGFDIPKGAELYIASENLAGEDYMYIYYDNNGVPTKVAQLYVSSFKNLEIGHSYLVRTKG